MLLLPSSVWEFANILYAMGKYVAELTETLI